MGTSVMSQDRLLSVHQEHELLLKLEQAGLDSELAQEVIGSKGNQLAEEIVQLIDNRFGILEPVATYRADGAEQFNAAEKFREGETDGVKIVYLNSTFKENFQNKVERDVESAELQTHDLRESARDPEIISDLVGRKVSEGDELQAAAAQVESTLSHLWSLLKAQGDGDDGPVLTNGYANVFYIRDTNGTLWAVYVNWPSPGGGWCVRACSLGRPHDWDAGRRLFSRDS